MIFAALLAGSIAFSPAQATQAAAKQGVNQGATQAAPGKTAAAPSKAQGSSGEREYATGPAIPKLRFQQILPNLKLVRPVQMFQRPGDAANVYIIEQPGRIFMADPAKPDTTEAAVALDIRARVNDSGNEEGLLSAAFHPDFPKKRELYLYYTAAKPRRSILSRFTVSEDGKTVDPASEEVILTQAQPYSNHNGGTVLFGPDGMLYLSLGDGGAADDPHGYGQNLGTFLGKVLRIDVGRKGDGGAPYAVPADNPFVGKEGAKPEIWAYGTRNIWRMAFDPKSGQLWAGDVGQNEWEEISVIVKGGNYGWNAREGFHRFARGKGDGPFIEPVVEYGHREGLSVTGGVVYRGKAIDGLDGVYVYGDFAFGTVWGIRMIDGKPTKPAVIAQRRGELISSIDALQDGTIVLSTFNRGQDPGNPGSLWKLVAASN